MIEDDFSRRYGDLLTGSYDCVDRIVLNAYMSLCHSPGGFRVWWRRWHDGSDDQLDNTHLMRMAGRFSRRVRAFAGAHGIPLVDCGRGERKHRIAEEYLATHTVGPGLFLGTSVSEGWSADDLAVRVAALEVRVAQLFNELADVTVLMTDVPVSDAGTPSPRYDTLDDWVREYFAPTFGRPIGGEIRWCAHWREHAEAIGRLERSGDRGRRCASIPPWAWSRGSRTTSTRSLQPC